MRFSNLTGLIGQNVRRSKRNFIMSGIGILVGVSTLVFFVGLGEGIKDIVLNKIFLVEQIEVVQKTFDTGLTQSTSVLGLGGTRPLDQRVVDDLAAIEGVQDAFPKMKFTFPTRGWGGKKLFGRDIWAEIIADGIEPALVREDLSNPDDFRDWDVEIQCEADSACPAGRTCQAGQCEKIACKYDRDDPGAACPGASYCTKDTKRCELPIPVIVSFHLLELYNGSLATAMSRSRSMPRLSKKTVIGFGLNVTFGKSFLGRSKRAKPITRRVKLVGFSNKAITVGITLPIGYVNRLNRRFSGAEAAATFHSIILEAKDQTYVHTIAKSVKQKGFAMADKTTRAEQAGMMITIITLVFSLISVIIVAIAAINIGQTFFMIIYQRKREIGVLRAIGATRGDIRSIILGEATLIGMVGGVLGVLLGMGAADLADYLSFTYLPEFPYKPESFFLFPGWLWGAALGFAVAFCLIGAVFPAAAAARMEPAQALTN